MDLMAKGLVEVQQ